MDKMHMALMAGLVYVLLGDLWQKVILRLEASGELDDGKFCRLPRIIRWLIHASFVFAPGGLLVLYGSNWLKIFVVALRVGRWDLVAELVACPIATVRRFASEESE